MSRAGNLSQSKSSIAQPLVGQLSVVVFLWSALIGCGAMLAWLSVLRYNGYNAGMLDLGNMSQAVASVRRGEPLNFTYVDGVTSRLAFHVEFIYFLFVPFYALWPDPRVLLIGQAALFALGTWPTYRLTQRLTRSTFAAICMALIYLFYPTAQTSVLFDFHGDTLALPLLMFALDALDEHAWRRYWIFLVLALSCKFYVALPVAMIGLLIWRMPGLRRVGLWTIGLGLVYGVVAFFVVRPLFTTAQTSEAHRGIHYLSFYFGQFSELFATFPDRVLSGVVVFGPVLLIAWRGWRWLLPALPIAAAALLSTGPGGAFDYRYHHYAIAVPFIIMAAIEGARSMQERQVQLRRGRSWRGDMIISLIITLIFNVFLVDTPLNPFFWLHIPGVGRDPSMYGITTRDAVKDRFLTEFVPPAVPMAASAFIGPHLVDRDTLYLVRYPDDSSGQRLPSLLPQVEYVLADGLFDWRMPTVNGQAGGLPYERAEIGILLRDPSFGLVAERDGLLLFRRDPPAGTSLTQSIQTASANDEHFAVQPFGDGPELVAHHIEQFPTPTGSRWLRASFTWRTKLPLRGRSLVAVSRLEGVPDARFIHLPSYVLLPTDQWQPGQLVTETFDISLPTDLGPGTYTWQLGWYDALQFDAASTDGRSRIGDEAAIETIEIR